MALSLWQGPVCLGDVYAHGVIARRRLGQFGCILAFLAFRFDAYRPGEPLEVRNGDGERVGIRVLSLARSPGATIMAEFDGTVRFNWGGPSGIVTKVSDRPTPAKVAKTNSVLVVEDDDALRESLLALLSLEGFQAKGVCNGREALEHLLACAGSPPNVIVLDLAMPEMSGPEFCVEQQRHDQLSGIPVVVLSASQDGKRQAEAMKASEFFPKPFAVDAFFNALRSKC